MAGKVDHAVVTFMGRHRFLSSFVSVRGFPIVDVNRVNVAMLFDESLFFPLILGVSGQGGISQFGFVRRKTSIVPSIYGGVITTFRLDVQRYLC